MQVTILSDMTREVLATSLFIVKSVGFEDFHGRDAGDYRETDGLFYAQAKRVAGSEQ